MSRDSGIEERVEEGKGEGHKGLGGEAPNAGPAPRLGGREREREQEERNGEKGMPRRGIRGG